MRRAFSSIAALSSVAAAALAAGASLAEDTMLVLDASGSMWGQIDGVTKIEIAREVMGGVLEATPADRSLGLVAYGHRREGDCTDIELIAAPGADREALRASVNALKPKGKTPISASVRQAAEVLKFRDAPATVVLVSDGEETCAADPCAVARELEAAGVDLTVHVVGFGLETDLQRESLQCVAEETGGRFILADNAGQLADALNETVTAAPSEPVAVTTEITVRATELSGGPEVTSGLSWSVAPATGGDAVFKKADAGRETLAIEPGVYRVAVERADGLKGQATVSVERGTNKTVTIPLELSFEASVSPEPAGSAPAGSTISVAWTGPARKGDIITLVPKAEAERLWADYVYVERGNPVDLRTPSEPGDYVLRYTLGSPTKTLAEIDYALTPVTASLTAPDAVAASVDFQVEWTGPGYEGDWLTIVAPDAEPNRYADYRYTRDGNPITLKAPVEVGQYEVRYVTGGDTVLARRPITIGAVEASVSAPTEAVVGTEVSITWTGPENQNDWITIIAADAEDRRYADYAYVKNGNPAKVKMPTAPGDYEIRYVARGEKVIARAPIKAIEAGVSVEAPDSFPAGSLISIGFAGPNAPGDFITITTTDAHENRYTDYKYAKNGSPAKFKTPFDPGAYEVRYVLNGTKVIARRPITITAVDATLDGPASVSAGADFNVAFTGPAQYGDFVTITKPEDHEGRYISYQYAERGSPVELEAPVEAGAYELRYVLGGRKVIARQPISLTPANASVSGPSSAKVGTKIAVDFTGPAAKDDYISIVEVGAADNRYQNLSYANRGSPAMLDAPATPGAYELRYVVDGSKVIARQAITITP